MAFLRATLAAQDVTEGLKKNHGVVRDFMHELLGTVGVGRSLSDGLSMLKYSILGAIGVLRQKKGCSFNTCKWRYEMHS